MHRHASSTLAVMRSALASADAFMLRVLLLLLLLMLMLAAVILVVISHMATIPVLLFMHKGLSE
jgi:hypothetical protein